MHHVPKSQCKFDPIHHDLLNQDWVNIPILLPLDILLRDMTWGHVFEDVGAHHGLENRASVFIDCYSPVWLGYHPQPRYSFEPD